MLFCVRKGRLVGGGHGGTRVPFMATPSIPTVEPVTLRSTASPCKHGNKRVYTQMHMLFLREAPGSPPSSGTQTAPQHGTWGHFIQRPRPQKHRGGQSVALRRLRRTGAPSSSRDRQVAASGRDASWALPHKCVRIDPEGPDSSDRANVPTWNHRSQGLTV